MTDNCRPPITLSARGKTFGRLFDGRYLQFKRGDLVIWFDMAETVRNGRAVTVRMIDPPTIDTDAHL